MSAAAAGDAELASSGQKLSSRERTRPSWLLRFFPSLTDFAFLIPIIILFTILQGTRTLLSDGDTGWHIRAGDWILQHHQVPSRDLFSFTMPHREWFAWEWGWDVLFSFIHTRWGLSGVALGNILLLGCSGVLLYRLVRRQAKNDVLALMVTSIAMLGSSVHWLARPHLLSWIFVLIFLHLIARAEEGDARLLWWTPLLTALWVNLHGSFFLGIFLLGTCGAVKSLQALVMPRRGASCASAGPTYFLTGAACLGASLINPYGWRLHEHVLRYLLDAKQIDAINEYAPINFHSPLALCLEFFLVLGACAAYRLLTEGKWAQAAMLLLSVHPALKSARNVPIFLFIAAPPVAALLTMSLEQVSRTEVPVWLRSLAAGVLNFGKDFRLFERVERIPVLPAAALLLFASALGVVGTQEIRIADFDKRDFPVDAAAVIAQWPEARVFTFDQWGDYLIYRSFPRRAAFVDGRSDFYGSKFGDHWLNALNAQYDWQRELSQFAINTVLLKTSCPLAAVLKESPEWSSVFDDGSAIVFRKVIAP